MQYKVKGRQVYDYTGTPGLTTVSKFPHSPLCLSLQPGIALRLEAPCTHTAVARHWAGLQP